MIIITLSEIIWRTYQDGRTNATKQTFRKGDIKQMAKMVLGSTLRKDYYQTMKIDPSGMADTTDISVLLSTIRFTLPTSDSNRRRADMSAFDLYRMPHNSHVVNIYPVGDSCTEDDQADVITLVEPGEENFYRSNPDFSFFQFGVVKGRGVNVYNVPPCVDALDIESSFDTDQIDIPFELAFAIAVEVLGTLLKVPDFIGKNIDNSYDPPMKNLRTRMNQQQEAQPEI